METALDDKVRGLRKERRTRSRPKDRPALWPSARAYSGPGEVKPRPCPVCLTTSPRPSAARCARDFHGRLHLAVAALEIDGKASQLFATGVFRRRGCWTAILSSWSSETQQRPAGWSGR